MDKNVDAMKGSGTVDLHEAYDDDDEKITRLADFVTLGFESVEVNWDEIELYR
jgi:hypothetical protein